MPQSVGVKPRKKFARPLVGVARLIAPLVAEMLVAAAEERDDVSMFVMVRTVGGCSWYICLQMSSKLDRECALVSNAMRTRMTSSG